jgi:hypothetical protein
MDIFRFDIAGKNSLSLVDFTITGIQFILSSIPKKLLLINLPESGFEARYERVTIVV